jgi:predicted nucleic acid-binding protein
LRTIGALGVLIAAKRNGRIQTLANEIAALRKEAGFFIDANLEAQVLASVGE